MTISLIVAYDRHRGIGKEGKLPWHIPADLQLFKRLTWGHHIVMGRRTFESIGRVLPGRTTIVVSRNSSQYPEGCFYVATLEQALALAQERGETECFLIGGARLYAAALSYAHRIYASEIEGEFDCDVFFPHLDPGEWEERWATTISSANAPSFRFRILDRKGSALPLPTIANESVHLG